MNISHFLDADHLLVKTLAGSHSYGTSLPTSDVDYRGIFLADPINYRTPFFPVEMIESQTEEDTSYYELSKFMKLYLDANPNIVELLWVDEEDIVSTSEGYKHLRSHRSELLSSKVAFTFSGYATAQLKRIKGHNKWISNPQPVESPKPCEFLSVVLWLSKTIKHRPNINDFLNDHRLIPYGNNMYGIFPEKGRTLWDEYGNLNETFEGHLEQLGPPLIMVKWNKEEYKVKKEKHEQYWTWKNNRNKVRSELEEDHGYDTKHAMHLVRLMRMGVEILRDEIVLVKRPDAEELLAIRNGAWTYDELLKYAEDMDNQIQNVWYKQTKLPKHPNIKLAAKVMMKVQDIMWK